MLWGTAVGTGYGLWQAFAHLPAGLSGATWLASAAWCVTLLAGAGAVFTTLIAGLAYAAGAPVGRNWRASVSAAVEAVLWLPLLTWFVVNELLHLATGEVLGIGSMLLLWHNTWAVLENAWGWCARYLIAAGILTLAGTVAINRAAARSFRGLYARAEYASSVRSRLHIPPLDKGGLGGVLEGCTQIPIEEPPFGPPCQGGKQDSSSTCRTNPRGLLRSTRWAGALTGGLAVLIALLAWEIHTRPGEALTAVCRSAPPLRAFNLVQTLSERKLRGPMPTSFGPPIITDRQYAADMGTPRRPTPNVVYLLLESTPARALHCYGYPKTDITQNLDRLAAEGVRFAHCVAPSSFSSCSVVSLLTSLCMLRGERFDHFADLSFPFMSFPRALKLAGYELTLFSSGNESFDNINHFCSPADFDTYFAHETCPIKKSDCMRMDDQYAVGEFEKWIAARKGPRPFYCGFYLQSPHFNYQVPEPWASHYQPVPPLYSNGDGVLQIPPDVLPKLKNQYDNAMRYTDYWVGRIVADLQKAGVLDRTVIIATGDHGEAFMEHGLARHGVHTWEEMIHTPLIIWMGPKIRASWPQPLPSVVAHTVSGLDIAPTLAAIVGITPHPSWQGVNALDPRYDDRDRPVFSMTQYTRWQETVCLDGMKYLYDLTDAKEYLFDLRADPGERHNLAAAKPALAAVMLKLLAGWHTYQLAYYSVPRRDVYAGTYTPPAALLDAVHQAAGMR